MFSSFLNQVEIFFSGFGYCFVCKQHSLHFVPFSAEIYIIVIFEHMRRLFMHTIGIIFFFSLVSRQILPYSCRRVCVCPLFFSTQRATCVYVRCISFAIFNIISFKRLQLFFSLPILYTKNSRGSHRAKITSKCKVKYILLASLSSSGYQAASSLSKKII